MNVSSMTVRLRAIATLVAVSALFFLITAGTFTSLGVVLPSMVAELHWSWSIAGIGFSLLGILCGVTSYLPAAMIRRIGVRGTFAVGTVMMSVAFLTLGFARSELAYFLATSLAGAAFSLLATVPGTYLMARCFERRGLAFGIYFTIGGLGGVAGPWLYFGVMAVSGVWRDYWLVLAAAIAIVGIISTLVVDTTTDVGLDSNDARKPRRSTVYRAAADWSVRDALRTPQFYIIAAAYTAFLFCGITVNSVSVAFLTEHGVAATLAGGMLSLEALINAAARAGGGAIADHIEPKRLLALALVALIVGMAALSVAGSLPMLLIYAAGIGIGYGLTLLASTLLLLNYYGRRANLELFSFVNLAATAASAGPALAGWTRDSFGSFIPFFIVLALGVGVVLLAVILMRPPGEPRSVQSSLSLKYGMASKE